MCSRKSPRAARLARAGERRAEVLQQERHARQRALGERTSGGLPGPLVQRRHDGVEPRVQRLDSLDRGVDELERRNLAAPDQVRLAEGVETAELGGGPERHGRSSAASS